MTLVSKKCTPCEGKRSPLTPEEALTYFKEIPEWKADESFTKISREFEFDSFVDAINFVNDLAHLAEEEGHHPDIHIFYNKVRCELWTHAINGLSENDFILTAKIDSIFTEVYSDL
jgi:4a-hydroxytetrahydrobiopterin dehydratase